MLTLDSTWMGGNLMEVINVHVYFFFFSESGHCNRRRVWRYQGGYQNPYLDI